MKGIQEELQKKFLEYLIDYEGPKGREINWKWEEFNLLAKDLAEIANQVQK